MEFLTQLWLAIVLSAVFVFVVSSIMHMLIPIHRGDFRKLSAEDVVLEQLRSHALSPGEYMFPCAGSMKDMGTPEMLEKYNRGPVGFLTIMAPGPVNMAKALSQWFVYSLVISVFCAYVAWHVLDPGAHYLSVFRIVGTVAFLAYAGAYAPNSIWKGIRWTTTIKYFFDGAIYAMVTAGTFGWLWPTAS